MDTVTCLGCSILLTAGSALAAPAAGPQAAAARTTPATFHVDSEGGRDEADGRTPESAWKTLQRVSGAELISGDSVLFRRGGLWRGSLSPQSGKPGQPITYSAYGEGEKPILQGSVARDAATDWEEHSPGIWATRRPTYTLGEAGPDLRQSEWSCHQENGAQVTVEKAGDATQVCYRLVCTASGTAPNHIQFWGPVVPEDIPETVMVRLRLRCTAPFFPARLQVMRNGPPWTSYRSSGPEFCEVTQSWQTVEVILRGKSRGDLPRLHLYLGGRLPAGATFEFEPIGMWGVSADRQDDLSVDVGNIIFDHGKQCGLKKWRLEDLKAPGDYLYSIPTHQVLLRAEANPATLNGSIEMALREHIISQGGAHDVVYDGLMLRYGAAHGIGGGSTARVTVRRCDLCYIGGGHQFTTPEGHPVRFGNGIEFWDAGEENLVEGCRLWEIYDAALTNQGSGKNSKQTRITYRNNVIWNAEYSFEYWNRPAEAVTEDILFENNTCVDSGLGWAHGQRPDPNGGHLMFYHNAARTARFVVRDNLFCNSTEVCLRMDNDWRSALTLEHNLWYQEAKPVVRYLVKQYYSAGDMERFRQETGLDAHSAVAAPRFVDAAGRDYRLAADSPGQTLAHDGGSIGARSQD